MKCLDAIWLEFSKFSNCFQQKILSKCKKNSTHEQNFIHKFLYSTASQSHLIIIKLFLSPLPKHLSWTLKRIWKSWQFWDDIFDIKTATSLFSVADTSWETGNWRRHHLHLPPATMIHSQMTGDSNGDNWWTNMVWTKLKIIWEK